MPVYLANLNGKESLIKAATVAGARNHVLKPIAPEISMLDGEGVAEAMGRGLKLEHAGETAEEAAARWAAAAGTGGGDKDAGNPPANNADADPK